MASQIHPASATEGQIEYSIPFTKADGSPGTVEPGTLVIELADPAMGVLVVDEAAMTVKAQHNGSAGMTTMKGTADGNLEAGPENVHSFSWTEEITFLPPLGAVAGGFTAGPEGPIS